MSCGVAGAVSALAAPLVVAVEMGVEERGVEGEWSSRSFETSGLESVNFVEDYF